MSAFDQIEAPPRRTMTLFYVIDTSGSMAGEKIASVNQVITEIIPMLRDISANNADAKIKIAALEFASGVEWMYNKPEDVENFQWRDLEAGGMTSLGEAYKELNDKLSISHGFMQEAAGSFAPVIILLSDGEPTDNYQHQLEKLKNNSWYKNAIKVAIAIGEDANRQVLVDFTGVKSGEGVLTVHKKDELKKIIKFVSVTASQVASSHASAGKDAPETKQEEMIEKITETLKQDEEWKGVDLGMDVTPNADAWAEDNF